MDQTLFISEAKLKQNSNLLENIDAKYVRNAILKAQRIKVLPVMGSDLYDKISGLINTGEIGSTGGTAGDNSVYKNLLDNELQQSVIPSAISYLLVSLSYKITQKGTQQSSDDLSTPVDLSTIQYLVGQYDNETEYWLQRMLGYLREFENDIPEYSSPDRSDFRNIAPDKRNQWSSMIYLRGRKQNLYYGDNAPNSGEANN